MDRGNAPGMRPRFEPVEELGADRPSPFAASGMLALGTKPAGDQQDHPRSLSKRLRQTVIEPGMRGIESASVKVEREVRLDNSASQLPVPGRIEAELAERTTLLAGLGS